jgi:homoserine O-succinyltransferase
MSLVAHSSLPTFGFLRREGCEISDRADPALPILRIGLLNLMPDAALQATERQFLRLINACGRSANLYVFPFAVEDGRRADIARAHIDAHYSDFAGLQAEGLDALIITGANPTHDDITKEPFWQPMLETIDWGRENATSVLCSCLATHAVLHHYHGRSRRELPQRQWGVYDHEILVPEHPLLAGLSAPVSAPHSHRFAVLREDMEAAGLTVLIDSKEAGVHLAVSSEPQRLVLFQGHPEYDAISLLKEYKREVQKFLTGNRPGYPSFPEHYFDKRAKRRLDDYQRRVTECDFEQATLPAFPEDELSGHYVDTWSRAGRMIYRNWLESLMNNPVNR